MEDLLIIFDFFSQEVIEAASTAQLRKDSSVKRLVAQPSSSAVVD